MAGNFEEQKQPGWLTELDKNKKRWLITGIVLHSVLTPPLREYVTDSLEQIYQTLKLNNNIDSQLHPNYLKSYLTTFLNYEAINGNKAIGLRQQNLFLYQVKSAVDFSKLFLQTNMAHYTAFDDSCDSSALLAIIIGSSPRASQACAKKVKDEVRNPWAHCDFTVWDDIKYKDCMKLIKELIESLGLKNQGEIISLLQRWNQNGDKYIDGTSPESVVLGEVLTQTHTLLSCIERIDFDTPEQISKLTKELNSTVFDLMNLMKRVEALEKNQQDITASVERLNERLDKKEDTISKEKYQIHIDEWEKDEKKFIVTRASEHVFRSMEENDVVVVTGSSGSGKSSLIHHVALTLKKQGYNIIPFVSGPDDIIQYRDIKKNQLFIIDDLCGKNYINETDLEIWKKQTDKIEKFFSSKTCYKQGRLKILVSCRLLIYQDKRFKSLDLFNKKYVNLQSKEHCYLAEEKRSMIRKYIKNSISDCCWQKIVEKLEDCHFFPLLCKMSQNKTVKQLTDLFSAPIECMRKNIRDIIQTKSMENCALVLCVLFPTGFDILLLKPKTRPTTLKHKVMNVFDIAIGNEMKIEKYDQEVRQKIKKIVSNFKINLDIEKERRELINTFERLDGTYVKKIGHLYFISHDKLYDMVAVEGCHDVTELYLEYAPSTFIAEQFRFTSVFPKEDNQVLIYLNSDDENLYMKRCFEDLRKQLYKPFFNNEQLKDTQYRQKVMEYIYQNNKSCKKIFRCLDKEGITETRKTFYGDTSYNYTTTPVIEATKIGFYQLIEYFIAIKCDLNKQDSNNHSPLFYSCSHGFNNIINLLLNHNVKYNIDDLVMACGSGMTNAVVEMVGSGLVDLTLCHNETGQTPLNAACEGGYREIVNLLLNHCVNYTVDDLVMACGHGMTDEVRGMVQRGLVNLTLSSRKYNQTPLTAACRMGRSGIVNLLLNHNVNYSVDDLVVICRHGLTFAVRVMIKRGLVDITLCSKEYGETSLTAACRKGHSKIVIILLNHNVKYSIDDVVEACRHGMTDAVRVMVEKGLVELSLCHSKTRQTPLNAACERGHSEIVNLLLKHNVQYCIEDLVMTCDRGMTNAVKVMVEKGLVDLSRCHSKTKQTPLNAACYEGHNEIVILLLNHNVKCNGDDLVDTCRHGMTEAVRIMVERMLVNLSECHIKVGYNPLTAACSNGHREIVNLLLSHNVSYHIDDVVMACRHGMTDAVRVMVERGLVDLSLCDKWGQTPLWAACWRGHNEISNILLNHNVQYNIDDLVWACKWGMADVVVVMIKRKLVDLSQCDRSGHTPLTTACDRGHKHILEILLASGVDPSQRDTSGKTGLDYTNDEGIINLFKPYMEQ